MMIEMKFKKLLQNSVEDVLVQQQKNIVYLEELPREGATVI